MSLTFDEKGLALTETIDSVTMPVDCSFEKVNDWIHGIDVIYEELEALCLGMASENDKLRKALRDKNMKSYIEGYRAVARERTIGCVPYHEGEKCHTDWLQGFNDALEDIKQKAETHK